MKPRLVIFDLDGTLVDSQHAIMAAMQSAYGSLGIPAPLLSDVLGIVGLSLDQAFACLSPDVAETERFALCEAYKTAYATARQAGGAEHSPLYQGALETLNKLHAQDWTLLSIATGKSKRGTLGVIEAHGLEGMFVSVQTADDHPSKPHPSMVQACLADAGVATENAVMVGDTTFDMDMAAAAGVAGIGVDWGYHPASELNAACILTEFSQLPDAIDGILGPDE